MNPPSPVPPPAPENGEILAPAIYEELRRIAAARMAGQPLGHTLQPTVLVHEAWLRISGRDKTWRDRNHFLATAATAMRHILIDHARQKSRLKHGRGHIRAATATFAEIPAPSADDKILLINEGIIELEKVHPERSLVVIARFFGGLTNKEIADNLGIGERSVERHWALAKIWLLRWIKQANPAGTNISGFQP